MSGLSIDSAWIDNFPCRGDSDDGADLVFGDPYRPPGGVRLGVRAGRRGAGVGNQVIEVHVAVALVHLRLRIDLEHLRDGDTLVVWRLDRLGRSLPHLIETVEGLRSRGVVFKSLTEAIDTSSPSGMLIFQIFGALAQFERALIQELIYTQRASVSDVGLRLAA